MNLAVLRVAVIKRSVASHRLFRLQLSEQTDAWERQLRGCETEGLMLEAWGRCMSETDQGRRDCVLTGDEADQGRRDCVLTMVEAWGRTGWGQRRNQKRNARHYCA